jgi:transposase
LSIDQEQKLLKRLEEKALSGEILIYKHIKKEVEKRIEHEVSDDYIWDLFKRHNWKKKAPMVSHPKSDKETQQEFKKNSKCVWMPND